MLHFEHYDTKQVQAAPDPDDGSKSLPLAWNVVMETFNYFIANESQVVVCDTR